jgi:transcriptional regulator with XRE-family HTH domain
MKGADVVALRDALGWTGEEFAGLLGVHASTVYRWEKDAEEHIKAEPLQAHLLTVLATEWERREDKRRQLLRDALNVARLEGGNLKALYVLLAAFYNPIGNDEPPRRRAAAPAPVAE